MYTGAGISASAGIPTYRGNNGIYRRPAAANTDNADNAANADNADNADNDALDDDVPSRTAAKRGQEETSNVIDVDITQCAPTPAHMALTRLIQLQRVRFVVSQNIDNLHRRSGLGWPQLAEIHGNACLEYCASCREKGVPQSPMQTKGEPTDSETSPQLHVDAAATAALPSSGLEAVWSRQYDVTGKTAKHRHKTGRECPQCSAPLLDTIVHYGEKAQ